MGQIHHIEFWVSNLEKTIKFWAWILEYLGYSKYQDDPKYKYTGDNQVIHIEDPDTIELEFVASS